MSEPLQPWQGDVWRRGTRLGMVWLGLFALITVALYLILGLTGWSGAVRALCAMGIGPVLGSMAIAGWWMIRRPNLSGSDAGHAREGQGHEPMEQ